MELASNFWAIQNETGSIDRFLARVGPAVIFADPEFSAIARSCATPPSYELVTFDPSQNSQVMESLAPNCNGRNVFLFCVKRYADHAAALKTFAQKSGSRFIDWPHEVFPSFIGYNDSWRQTDEELVEPKKTFVLISTARSGSTFLSELMHKNGFGNPKEHIRIPFFELVRARQAFGLDLKRLSQRIVCTSSKNGYFATKVISGFLYPILSDLNDGESHALFSQWWNNPVVYLVRESKLEQSISDVIANATKTWHVRSAEEQQKYDLALKDLSFDFAKVNQRFCSYVKDEIELRAFVARLPSVIHLTYADLVANPDRELRRLLTSIDGVNLPETLVTTSEMTKTASTKHREFAARFIEETRARGLYRDKLDDPLYSELK